MDSADDSAENEYTLDIKIAQIFIVLFFSCIGMAGPLFFGNRISVATMFLLRAFAAGQNFLKMLDMFCFITL